MTGISRMMAGIGLGVAMTLGAVVPAEGRELFTAKRIPLSMQYGFRTRIALSP